MAVQQARQAQADSQVEVEPADDEGQELQQVKGLIDAAVMPLADKLDMLIDAVQTQAASAPNSAAAAELGEPAAPAQKPATTAPKKRSVVIKRDANGRMTGADLIDADEPGEIEPQQPQGGQ